MHNRRRDRGNELEFWGCGATKVKGGRCPVKGNIHPVWLLRCQLQLPVWETQRRESGAGLSQQRLCRQRKSNRCGAGVLLYSCGCCERSRLLQTRTSICSMSLPASSSVAVAVPITAASPGNAKTVLRRGLGTAPVRKIPATTPAYAIKP